MALTTALPGLPRRHNGLGPPPGGPDCPSQGHTEDMSSPSLPNVTRISSRPTRDIRRSRTAFTTLTYGLSSTVMLRAARCTAMPIMGWGELGRMTPRRVLLHSAPRGRQMDLRTLEG